MSDDSNFSSGKYISRYCENITRDMAQKILKTYLEIDSAYIKYFIDSNNKVFCIRDHGFNHLTISEFKEIGHEL